MCVVGFGGTDCATQCGGSNATYGTAGREKGEACVECPVIAVGFYFDYMAINRNFTPAVVARPGAVSPADCLAEFGQIADLAWYMGRPVDMARVADVGTFEACVEDCKRDDDFQDITYDYNTTQCYKKVLSNTGTR